MLALTGGKLSLFRLKKENHHGFQQYIFARFGQKYEITHISEGDLLQSSSLDGGTTTTATAAEPAAAALNPLGNAAAIGNTGQNNSRLPTNYVNSYLYQGRPPSASSTPMLARGGGMPLNSSSSNSMEMNMSLNAPDMAQFGMQTRYDNAPTQSHMNWQMGIGDPSAFAMSPQDMAQMAQVCFQAKEIR